MQGLPSSQEAIKVKHPHTPPSTTCVVSLRLKVPVNYTISQWSFHLVLFFILANRDLSLIHLTFEGETQNGHEKRFKSRKFYDFNK